MQELGVKILIITNAAGGINLSFDQGSIMLIKDHINLTGENPLVGHNHDAWGLRFPDMINAYDKDLLKTAADQAKQLGIGICSGVYAGLKGPSLETPAEIRFLKTIGADAVGLSTIQEAIAGVHAQMRVLGISVITNINNPDNPEPATLEGVIAAAGKVAPLLESLIETIVGAVNADESL
jgi:purine-nucleoside phosphorylase